MVLFIPWANCRTKCRTRCGIPAFTQWRDADREDVETVVKVAAKLPLQDHFAQVAVGRGHHPNIHLSGLCAAQPLIFPLLQDAKQLGLQLQRDIADLVEKD